MAAVAAGGDDWQARNLVLGAGCVWLGEAEAGERGPARVECGTESAAEVPARPLRAPSQMPLLHALCEAAVAALDGEIKTWNQAPNEPLCHPIWPSYCLKLTQ